MAIEFADAQAGRADPIARYASALLDDLGGLVADEVRARTPARVSRAWRELTEGYRQSPTAILSKTFDSSCDEMVVVNGIEFASTCAHHLLPFTGTATIAYIPSGRIVGLSKLPRLLHCFARRLQLQEELTQQVADAIQKHLQPRGVGVLLRGVHSCMALRGVKCRGEMVTSSLLGAIKSDASARAEFLSLANGRG